MAEKKWTSIELTQEQKTTGEAYLCKFLRKGPKWINNMLKGMRVDTNKPTRIFTESVTWSIKSDGSGIYKVYFANDFPFPQFVQDYIGCMKNPGTYQRPKRNYRRESKKDAPVAEQVEINFETAAEEPIEEHAQLNAEDPEGVAYQAFDSLPAEIIPFHVSDSQVLALVAIKGLDGRAYVVVTKICEILGIDPWNQIEKIRDREDWLSGVSTVQLPNDQARKVFTICEEDLHNWLSNINPKRVAPSAKAALTKLQKECSAVIRQHFFPNTTRPVEGPPPAATSETTKILERISVSQEQTAQTLQLVQMTLTVVLKRQDTVEDSLARVHEINKGKLHVIDNKEKMTTVDFIDEMQKKYGRTGFLNGKTGLRYRPLNSRNITPLLQRAGLPVDYVRAKKLEEGEEGVVRLWDLHARKTIEPHIKAWFEYGTPHMEKSKQVMSGGAMATVGVDWKPSSLVTCLHCLGHTYRMQDALHEAYSTPPAIHPRKGYEDKIPKKYQNPKPFNKANM